MPFTPFHMGVGVAAKALAPRLISIQVFGLTQIAMDIEPGIGMATGSEVLHGWTHTLWGAVPVALACVVTWKLLEGRRIWRWTFEPLQAATLWLSAFWGAWSHVLLDVLIHRDMSATRTLIPALGETIFSHEAVESACLVAAVLGAVVLWVRWGNAGSLAAVRSIKKNLQAPARWFTKSPG